ncbi:MAG TPA: type II secretion system protein [Candidatus Paceibacterota bacterium]
MSRAKYLILNTRYQRGFTLTEVIIYVGLFAGIATLLVGSLVTILNIEGRENSANEVTSQLSLAFQTVQRLVRESSLIEKVYEGTDEGASCVAFCSVKLRMEDSAKDPSIIRSDADGVYLKEGAGLEAAITTDRIRVDNFKFVKFETSGTKAILQIDAAFTYNVGNPATAVSRALRSAVGRVSAATFDDDLLPNIDSSFNIGNSSNNWQSVFLSGDLTVGGEAAPLASPFGRGTIYFDTGANKFKVSENNGNYVDLIQGGASYWTGETGKVYLVNSGDNVGIGTTGPNQKLEVNGIIISGEDSATQGSLGFGVKYSGANIINTFGGQFSLGRTLIGYGVKPKQGAAGYVSSAGNVAFARGGLVVSDSLIFLNATSGTVPIGTDITMTERFRVNDDGNVGIGGSANPGSRLTVTGGDVYISNSTSGIILKSPDGTCARGTISNLDTLTFASTACPSN